MGGVGCVTTEVPEKGGVSPAEQDIYGGQKEQLPPRPASFPTATLSTRQEPRPVNEGRYNTRVSPTYLTMRTEPQNTEVHVEETLLYKHEKKSFFLNLFFYTGVYRISNLMLVLIRLQLQF